MGARVGRSIALSSSQTQGHNITRGSLNQVGGPPGPLSIGGRAILPQALSAQNSTSPTQAIHPDARSKLIISYLCGGRDTSWACQFMEDLASRVTTRIQITTDGLRAYAEAVEGAFGMDVDFAMLIKLYGAPSDPDSRYSPAQCIGIRTGILSGNPNRQHISTSFVERQNLNLRMGVRRFTRLTNAFSKKFENHCHMVAIYHAYYNFCRVHQTLRVTPAMEAGLADHVWSVSELVNLLESRLLLAA